MKALEIRNLGEAEIQQKVGDLEAEIFNLRFQSRSGKIDNPSRLRLVRRDIARMKTVLRERQLALKRPAPKGLEAAEPQKI